MIRVTKLINTAHAQELKILARECGIRVTFGPKPSFVGGLRIVICLEGSIDAFMFFSLKIKGHAEPKRGDIFCDWHVSLISSSKRQIRVLKRNNFKIQPFMDELIKHGCDKEMVKKQPQYILSRILEFGYVRLSYSYPGGGSKRLEYFIR